MDYRGTHRQDRQICRSLPPRGLRQDETVGLNEIEAQGGEDRSQILQRRVRLAVRRQTATFDGQACGRRNGDVYGTALVGPYGVGDAA